MNYKNALVNFGSLAPTVSGGDLKTLSTELVQLRVAAETGSETAQTGAGRIPAGIEFLICRCVFLLVFRERLACRGRGLVLITIQHGTNEFYRFAILRNRRKSVRRLAVPSTTLHSGSPAIGTGKAVSLRMRSSNFLSGAPPPVSTMPRSLMSALNSGGVNSSATRMAFMIIALAQRLAH